VAARIDDEPKMRVRYSLSFSMAAAEDVLRIGESQI